MSERFFLTLFSTFGGVCSFFIASQALTGRHPGCQVGESRIDHFHSIRILHAFWNFVLQPHFKWKISPSFFFFTLLCLVDLQLHSLNFLNPDILWIAEHLLTVWAEIWHQVPGEGHLVQLLRCKVWLVLLLVKHLPCHGPSNGWAQIFTLRSPEGAPSSPCLQAGCSPLISTGHPQFSFPWIPAASAVEPSTAAASVLLSSVFLLCSWCTRMFNRLWTQTCVLGFSFYIFILLLCIGSGEAY